MLFTSVCKMWVRISALARGVSDYLVGQEVREAIKRLGGTMPENLPTPEMSIQELQRAEQQRLKPGQQLSLLDEPDKEIQ
ncbi:MAG TPA: hypothetical protein VEH81_13600 [Ktedonobacteraceae bacterium]|nr:hypothetical protein [Ktedonobacteraceae bacterium]